MYELFECDCCGHAVETTLETVELLGWRISETGVYCGQLVNGKCCCGALGKDYGNKIVQ